MIFLFDGKRMYVCNVKRLNFKNMTKENHKQLMEVLNEMSIPLIKKIQSMTSTVCSLDDLSALSNEKTGNSDDGYIACRIMIEAMKLNELGNLKTIYGGAALEELEEVDIENLKEHVFDEVLEQFPDDLYALYED